MALLAFVALPVVTVPIAGSYTAADLAGLLGDVGLGGAAFLTWIVPIAALALLGAALAAWNGTPEAATAVAAVGLALATAALWLYMIGGGVLHAALSSIPGAGLFGVSASSVLSAGFWLVLLSLVAGMGGAVVQLEACSRIRRRLNR